MLDDLLPDLHVLASTLKPTRLLTDPVVKGGAHVGEQRSLALVLEVGQLVDGLGQVFESLLLNELLFNDGRFRNKLRSLSLHLLYQMINVIELHQLSQQTGSLKVSLIIQLLPRGKVIHILVEKWTDQVHALLQVYRREWIPITSFCQLFRLQQVKVAL